MTDTHDTDSDTSSRDASSADSTDQSGFDESDAPTDDRPTTDAVETTDGATSSEPTPEPDSDESNTSLGQSVAVYTLRLTVAFLVVSGRLLAAGGKIGWKHLGDATSRDRSRRWLLLEGDRRVIVGAFVAGIFVIALVLGVSDVIGVRESRFVTTMFSTMIAGLFSFIPIVVSVNQLIVSRLFGTPDRLTDRIDGVYEFRSRVESQTVGDGVSPTEPAPFLARLAGTLGERANALAVYCGGTCEASANGESDDASLETAESIDVADERSPALETVCAFASRTCEHAETLGEHLSGETSSVFDVVMPTMDYDYAASASEARRLRNRFDEELPDPASRALSELRELYVTADATRQYFTTMYLQQELARLSRLITYSGTAALLLSTLVIMIYASGYPPVAHEASLLVLVSLALAVAFSPLAVLFAYVVRIATILKRTSAPGAFTPPGEGPRNERDE